MKINNEVKGLQRLLLCSNESETLAKNSRISAIIFLLIGLATITLLTFVVVKDGRISTYFLFATSGGFLAMAYVKYVENIGILLISKYIDLEKINIRLGELDVEPNIEPLKAESPLKWLANFAVWIVIGIVITYIYRKYL